MGVEPMNVRSSGYIIKGVEMMDEIEIDQYGVITIRLGNGVPTMRLVSAALDGWVEAFSRAVTLSRQIEESMGDRT
jgi:hypothetical protein